MILFTLCSFASPPESRAAASAAPSSSSAAPACGVDFSRLGPPLGSMVKLPSGRRMYEEYWPARPGEKTFVFFHGLGEDSGEWDAIAGRIRKHTDYGYLRVDFHGHGKSVDVLKWPSAAGRAPQDLLVAKLSEPGAYERLRGMHVPERLPFEDNVEDALAMVRRHPRVGPLELVGHSYGGGVALAVGRALEDAGNPANQIHLLAPYVIRLEQGMLAELRHRYPQLGITNQIFTFFAPVTTQARNDFVEQAGDVLMDPLVGSFMAKTFGEFFQRKVTGRKNRLLSPAEIKYVALMTDSAIATTKGIRGFKPLVDASQIPTATPIHVVAGGEDKLVKRGLLEAFADKASRANDRVELEVIPEADHMFPIKRPRRTLRSIAPEVYPDDAKAKAPGVVSDR